MTATLRPLIISLKPCYADRLFEGLKTVELRRRIASQISDREVFIYVSSPVRTLRGGFRVGRVWEGTPESVWRVVSELSALNRQEFDAYFRGQAVAYALEITNVWEYQRPASLSWLRSRFDDFVVPQSWRYAKTEEQEVFQEMEKRRGDVGSGSPLAVETIQALERGDAGLHGLKLGPNDQEQRPPALTAGLLPRRLLRCCRPPGVSRRA